ncbi:CD3337/EF1877 family mobilome membrane protein [Enterococcus avium]|uniref:CD3337/EF1877 family mobilome membrane protein n=1 Tax=Enterococcus avium TaxID=33945 RepID=UPI0035CAD5CB
MKKQHAIKQHLTIVLLCLLAVVCLNVGTTHITQADQAGFEIGKTWLQNQQELEKTYKKATTIEKQNKKKGGVTLKIKEFPLSHYEAVANTGSIAPYNGALLNIANAIFSLNKFIANGFDVGIELLQGTDFLSTQINTVGSYTKQIWRALIENLLSLLVAIFILAFMFILFMKHDVIGAIKHLAGFVGVFLLGTLFLNFGAPIFQLVNDTSVAFEQTILSAGTSLVGNAELGNGESTKDTAASIMRNQVFDVGVYRPYLLMNYGTSNIHELDDGQKKVDKLLTYTQTVAGNKKKHDEVKKEAKDNVYMDKEGVGIYPKIGYALFSIVSTIGIGVPILVIASLNLLAQLLVAILFFFLAISFFVSLLPKFQDSWFKPLTGLIGGIFLKGLTAFFMMLIFVVITTINNAIPRAGVGAYACNVVIMTLVLNWLMKNRGLLVSMLVNRQPIALGNAISGQSVQRKTKNVHRAGNSLLRKSFMMKQLLGGDKGMNSGKVPLSTKGKGGNEKVPTTQPPSSNRNPKGTHPKEQKPVGNQRPTPSGERKPKTQTPPNTQVPKNKEPKNTNEPPKTQKSPQTKATRPTGSYTPSQARHGGAEEPRKTKNTHKVPPTTSQPPSPSRSGNAENPKASEPKSPSIKTPLVRQHRPSEARK